ncbi:hypothetical protein H3C66_00030 [Patescibacteria group bacterium]|nr:hypothetical protein [Patescibacteria group bacterium]
MTVQTRFQPMQMKKKVVLCAALLSLSVMLAGCAAAPTSPEDQAVGTTTEKQGDTTVSGKIVKLGDKYYLQAAGSPQQEVDSYSVDLSTYEGQNVTITGQFSGDTLFAGSVVAQ